VNLNGDDTRTAIAEHGLSFVAIDLIQSDNAQVVTRRRLGHPKPQNGRT